MCQENHPGRNVLQILGFLCEYPKSGSNQSVLVPGMDDGVVGEGSAGKDDAGDFFLNSLRSFSYSSTVVLVGVLILSFVSIEQIDFKFTNPLMKSFNLDIARITPVMPVASGGESTGLAMMISVLRHLEIT
nr:hypothetical protein [Tanacetum cinerariifolium]